MKERGRGREREIGSERDIYFYFGIFVTLYEPHPAKMQDRAAFTVHLLNLDYLNLAYLNLAYLNLA